MYIKTHPSFIYKLIFSVSVLIGVGSVFPARVYALTAADLGVAEKLGNIENFNQMVYWIINLLRWFGWAGVIIGVVLALFMLIYKLFAADSEESMKLVKAYMTRAVLIVVMGMLLLGAGFIVRNVAGLFGKDLKLDVITKQPATGGPSQPGP